MTTAAVVARTRSAARPRVPSLIAWLTRAVAVLAILDFSETDRRSRHAHAFALDVMSDAASFTVAVTSAGILLLLASSLRRRKRTAWFVTLVVLALGLAAGVASHRVRFVAIYTVLLLVLLLAQGEFTAESERTSRLAALRVFGVLAVISTLAGVFLTQRTAPTASLARRLPEVLSGLIGFAPELTFARPGTGDLTTIVLNSLGAITVLLTLAALLAPARQSSKLGAEAETRVRELLERWGDRDSLGYFALRRDKAVIFSQSGKAAIAYRVIGGVSLASGDPLGDPEAWPGAIEAWRTEADRFAWKLGVIGASEDAAIAYRRAGLDALELGDEAILEVSDYTLEGRAMRTVRQSVQRVARAGYTVEISRQRDLDEAERTLLMQTIDGLRGQEVERGFSMALGRFGDPGDPDLVVASARDGEGRVQAVLVFVPWGRCGLSLDVMRRATGSENGTMEFMVNAVVGAAPSLGITRISLNFAVFRSVFERGSRVGAGPVLRIWRNLLLFASRWWQIESLYRANAKYQPRWEPRFICFSRAGDLPEVGLAALQAEAFVQRPRLAWLAR